MSAKPAHLTKTANKLKCLTTREKWIMHKFESVLRSLIIKGLFISFGLISLAALYYRDGKFQIAENGNVIIEELFSGLILLYLFFTFFLVMQEKNRLICYALILSLWSLAFTYTKIWTTTLITYDEKRIKIFSRTPLFHNNIIIPFQAIKSVKKNDTGSGQYQMDLVNIEYITDDGETQEIEVYSGQFFNWFTGQNQQRRYEMFSRALIK